MAAALLLVLLAGCAARANGASDERRETLIDKVWAWTATKDAGGTVEVGEPTRYTVLLPADGDARIRFDCNRGGGPYRIEGERLSFGPLLSTRMACPADSLDSRFMDGLGRVESYRVEGETLTLTLGGDGGSMTFRLVGGSGAARDMARLSSESGSYARALDRGVEVAFESTVEPLELRLGRALSEKERERVRGVLRSALSAVVPAEQWERTLSEVYRRHFSDAEIAAALEFYRSPLGRKILEQDDAMSREVEDRIVRSFEARVDEFSGRVDAGLAEAFPVGSAQGTP